MSIFAYPHALTGILAAKDRNTIKRNAAALPIYTLALGLMALLGLFAIAKGVLPVDATAAGLAAGNPGDTNTITPMIFHTQVPGLERRHRLRDAGRGGADPRGDHVDRVGEPVHPLDLHRVLPAPGDPGRGGSGQPVGLADREVRRGGRHHLLDPAFSTEFQLIGSIVILQILPAVFFGLMTGWFHRWALMLGLIVGLGTSLYLLYQTPQISTRGVVVKEHFGGSSWPLERWGIDTEISVYIGLITVVVNLVVVVVVSAILKVFRVSPNLDHTRPEDYTADADVEGLDRLDHLLDGIPQKTGAHALR